MTSHASVKPMMPRVVAIVINWNGEQVLPRALQSLFVLQYPDISCVVVDNASCDGSPQWVESNYPQAHLLRSKRNLGFAGGCNLGIHTVLEGGAEYLLLLNNDIVLEENCLRRMVDEAESDERIGVVAPAVWRTDDPRKLDSAYGVICFNHVIVKRLGISRRLGRGFLTARDADCVFGSVLLVRAGLFDAVGCFDEDFWMFLEEVEFCYRARRAGFRVRYFPAAQALHGSGHSIEKAEADLLKTYLLRRNSVLFLKKHGNFFRWCKFLMWVGLSLGAQFFLGLTRMRWSSFRARWRGYRDGLSGKLLDIETLHNQYGGGSKVRASGWP